jgi:prepilin-type N-terminal cleavage/methylation domain-containing protein
MFRNNHVAPPLPDPQDNTNDLAGGSMMARRSCKLQVSSGKFKTRSSFATCNLQLATSPRGFTMIELLVVIGIILILIGLFFAGAKLVTAQAKQRDTKTMLETAKTMFENYKQATKLNVNLPLNVSQSPPVYYISIKGATVGQLEATNSLNAATGLSAASLVWSEGQEQARNTLPNKLMSPDNCGILVPGHSFSGGLDGSVRNTEVIMQAMLTVPENQTILNNLPASKRVMDVSTNIPLLLDGWGNVIIFCPGGGLTGVWVDPSYGNTAVITSEGVQPITYNPNNLPAGTPINNKPFFASAGPDGDMTNSHSYSGGTPTSDMTDDNIYSFQN